jgi:hypothetical protein
VQASHDLHEIGITGIAHFQASVVAPRNRKERIFGYQ